jgi:hypothetical protein
MVTSSTCSRRTASTCSGSNRSAAAHCRGGATQRCIPARVGAEEDRRRWEVVENDGELGRGAASRPATSAH